MLTFVLFGCVMTAKAALWLVMALRLWIVVVPVGICLAAHAGDLVTCWVFLISGALWALVTVWRLGCFVASLFQN